MSIPAAVMLIIGLVISAHTRLSGVILGLPVSCSPLLLIFAVVLLGLVIGLLLVVRTLIRDGLQLRPNFRTVQQAALWHVQ